MHSSTTVAFFSHTVAHVFISDHPFGFATGGYPFVRCIFLS